MSDVILNTTSPYIFANKRDQNSFEKLSKKTKSTRLGGDCYSYCLLAGGYVDMVVESGLWPWDIRALEPIILNAGGIIRTWENKKIFNGGRIIACSNFKLFKDSKSILLKKTRSWLTGFFYKISNIRQAHPLLTVISSQLTCRRKLLTSLA